MGRTKQTNHINEAIKKSSHKNLFISIAGKTSEEYRHLLGAYGVSGELATRPVSSLSGGQKSRVAFALMCAGK